MQNCNLIEKQNKLSQNRLIRKMNRPLFADQNDLKVFKYLYFILSYFISYSKLKINEYHHYNFVKNDFATFLFISICSNFIFRQHLRGVFST